METLKSVFSIEFQSCIYLGTIYIYSCICSHVSKPWKWNVFKSTYYSLKNILTSPHFFSTLTFTVGQSNSGLVCQAEKVIGTYVGSQIDKTINGFMVKIKEVDWEQEIIPSLFASTFQLPKFRCWQKSSDRCDVIINTSPLIVPMFTSMRIFSLPWLDSIHLYRFNGCVIKKAFIIQTELRVLA